MAQEFYVADLFAGCGGITQGFKDAGNFVPVVAVEFDKWAAQTYQANFGNHVLACPIEEVKVRAVKGGFEWTGTDCDGNPLVVETPPIDVIVGGPPCQGFSPLGRMNDWDKEDPRNRLWRHYVRILDIVRPKAFVLENVPELLRSSEFAILEKTVRKYKYHLKYDVLNSAHFGVPQVRRRAIVIGSKVGKASLPLETLERQTVRDAIGHLPKVPKGKPEWHLPRNPTAVSLERYKCIPEGGNRFDLMKKREDITPDCWLKKKTGSTDVFGRMWWDKPAPTIRTDFLPEKGRYLHPKEHRPITILEAALLQTFPPGFTFVGSSVQVAKQIGNAVPVKLAKAIAVHVKGLLLAAQDKSNGEQNLADCHIRHGSI